MPMYSTNFIFVHWVMQLSKRACIGLLKACKSMFHLKQIHGQMFLVGLHEDLDTLGRESECFGEDLSVLPMTRLPLWSDGWEWKPISLTEQSPLWLRHRSDSILLLNPVCAFTPYLHTLRSASGHVKREVNPAQKAQLSNICHVSLWYNTPVGSGLRAIRPITFDSESFKTIRQDAKWPEGGEGWPECR